MTAYHRPPAALVALLALGVALGAPARPAAAQAAPAPSAVRLRLGPRVGDTVRMRLDQTVVLEGRAADAAPGAPPASVVTTTLQVLSHAVVEAVTAAGTVLRTVTDAVTLSGTGTDAAALERARQGMVGRRTRVQLRGDGAMEVLDSAAGPAAAERPPPMPPSLPDHPVVPGDTWSRAMPLPVPPSQAAALAGKAGTLAVRFRFDSLGRNAELAHVSLRGSLSRDGGTDAQGRRYATTGTVVGHLVLDRGRGWLADSRTAFVVDALVTPPGDAGPGRPVRVRLKVEQRLRMM